ncbi:MAG TPA: pantoate--beta-alanine ligase [Phycisphaerales bacterium]|nr:pantoate--beta-alanine ligase [Phycisphaerales bacterium]
MKIVSVIDEIRECVRSARRDGKRLGLVPTMGALHAGHGALIENAVRECGFVVVSIFVNPTQFGPNEDFSRYPRTFEQDTAYCQRLGVDAIFAPSADQMYPRCQQTWVEVEKLTDGLCGATRPGHFRGVTTVCAKLFNIVMPDIAYFGQKDAQQAIVIRRMVDDLNFPLTIRVCPIVREPDGLAMSSRNRYLSPDERRQAVCLYQALESCRQMFDQGCRHANELIELMCGLIERAGGQIEYVSIVDMETLEPVEIIDRRVLVALAVFIGSTRLIDNCLLDLRPPEKCV